MASRLQGCRACPLAIRDTAVAGLRTARIRCGRAGFHLRSAGLTVTPSVSDDLSRLPSLISQEAYRIVQEALTNALKYSADRTAILGISLDDSALEILLSNPVAQRHPPRTGRGLSGIDERARALGGTVTAGARGDQWTLAVVLPVPEAVR